MDDILYKNSVSDIRVKEMVSEPLKTPQPPEEPTYHNGYEYVDLGLPSGTKWATMNVGASSTTELGMMFAWADTQGYYLEDEHEFTIRNYKYKSSSNPYYPFTKYGSRVNDTKVTIDLADDGVNVNMGGSWKMPSKEQVAELFNSLYTTVETITYQPEPEEFPEYTELINRVTSKINNKYIDFPPLLESDTVYWANECTGYPGPDAYYFGSSGNTIATLPRYEGCLLRGVIE